MNEHAADWMDMQQRDVLAATNPNSGAMIAPSATLAPNSGASETTR
jgi:hypothetical protein